VLAALDRRPLKAGTEARARTRIHNRFEGFLRDLQRINRRREAKEIGEVAAEAATYEQAHTDDEEKTSEEADEGVLRNSAPSSRQNRKY
jgi:hypothetical protein